HDVGVDAGLNFASAIGTKASSMSTIRACLCAGSSTLNDVAVCSTVVVDSETAGEDVAAPGVSGPQAVHQAALQIAASSPFARFLIAPSSLVDLLVPQPWT